MTEAERTMLYNDLIDYELELKGIYYPPKDREINILRRAQKAVAGERSKWILSDAKGVYDEHGNAIEYLNCTCEKCKFSRGVSTFRYCPNCGARMK